MADTLPNIVLTKAAYVDLYDESGIAVGTSLLIQNKSGNTVIVQEQAAQPAATSEDGIYIDPVKSVTVTDTPNGVWAIGTGEISVQEV